MKKHFFHVASLFAFIFCAMQVQAQRPEAIYARKAAMGQLKTVPANRNARTVTSPVPQLRTAEACPECQQISFGNFSPNPTYISVYGTDSIWTKTYQYLYQDPVWSGGFLNFSSGCLNFTHYADTSFGAMTYWDGFTVSKTTSFPCDTACGDACNGLQSQFSSITKGGSGGASDPYLAAYYGFNADFFPENHTTLTLNSPSAICGLYVTNNAYAYKSMKCGDDFAHKFAHGDSLLLTIKGYSGGSPTGQVSYFLADFRGSTSAYIVDAWKWVNLTALGTVDSLAFSLTTSDVGDFGANTPMYFCIDSIKVGTSPSCGTCAATDTTHNWFPIGGNGLKAAAAVVDLPLNIAPNPATTQITVTAKTGSRLDIFDASGNRKYSKKMTADSETITIDRYQAGVYSVHISYGGASKALQFIKK